MGELFAEVEASIPLHYAARRWAYQLSGPGHRQQASVAEMRWGLLIDCLGHYPLIWSPPVRRGRYGGATARSTITPLMRSCQGCGEAYFGDRRTRSCGCLRNGGGKHGGKHEQDGGAWLAAGNSASISGIVSDDDGRRDRGTC